MNRALRTGDRADQWTQPLVGERFSLPAFNTTFHPPAWVS